VQAGVEKAIIPKDNWNEQYLDYPITVVPVSRIEEVISQALWDSNQQKKLEPTSQNTNLLSASGRSNYTT